MTLTISTVIKQLEQWFPKHLAYDKDPIGLQVGSVNRPLTKTLVTLDVTLAVVEEAIAKGANLIVAHHPFIYRPLGTLNTNTPKGKVIEQCLKHDITIYVMHTNYDIASNGMNDCLARALGLTQVRPLLVTKQEAYSKVVIYVPETHADCVREAMAEAGVGRIGDYSHCLFSTAGVGSFKPLSGSTPFIGSVNEVEFVSEVKIEGIIESSQVSKVIQTIKEIHPYEEMAYDCYALDIKVSDSSYGLGRLGQLKTPVQVKDFIMTAKEALAIPQARFIGKLDKSIKTVAVIGGSGGSYIAAVKAQRADLFVTGDLGYHDAQDALDLGLNVLDVGHHVESLMKEHVATLLNEVFTGVALPSQVSTEPFQFI